VGRNAHSYGGLDWVSKLVDWVGFDLEKWTHGHLWSAVSGDISIMPIFVGFADEVV